MQFRQQSVAAAASGRFTRLVVAGAALVCGYAVSMAALAESKPVRILPADLAGGEEEAFAGRTLYRVQEDHGVQGLRATALATASGLCRKTSIDLRALPVVQWVWRLDRAPPRADECGRDGDDQGLRLSFLYRGSATPDSILAIQYIWSQNEPLGAAWPNAFVANAWEVVARSGPALPGVWQVERRNLAADFRAAFGRAVDRIDAVCVMTDGDQTGTLVEGWYGEIILQGP